MSRTAVPFYNFLFCRDRQPDWCGRRLHQDPPLFLGRRRVGRTWGRRPRGDGNQKRGRDRHGRDVDTKTPVAKKVGSLFADSFSFLVEA